MTKKNLFTLLGCFSLFWAALSAECNCSPPANPARLLDEWKQLTKGTAKKEVEFLITGCARSGTHYISRVFRQQGLSVKHEGDANYGIVSWTMAVDSDQSPWGPPSNNYYFKHIFHQVRDPLKTIASVMVTEGSRSWKFICSTIPEIKMSDPHIIRCAKYWYYWNLRAESKAELTYRIEDVATALPEMSRILGFHIDPAFLDQVPTDTGHRRKPKKLTWLDLRTALSDKFYDKMVCLAERYGYDVREAQRYNFKRKGK